MVIRFTIVLKTNHYFINNFLLSCLCMVILALSVDSLLSFEKQKGYSSDSLPNNFQIDASNGISTLSINSVTEEKMERTIQNMEENIDIVLPSMEDFQKFKNEIHQMMESQIANQYIVILKNNYSISSEDQLNLSSIIKEKKVELLNQFDDVVKGVTIKINDPQTLEDIKNNPNVAFVEKDQLVYIFDPFNENLTQFSSQIIPYGVDRIDGDLSSTKSGNGNGNVDVDIAILDTGVSLTHPDLNIYKQVTFVSGTTNANDDNGHGTHVAGIAAAKDNSQGSVGVAPGARIWAVKLLDYNGYGTISNIIKGVDYVTKNANKIDVANLSFGCECTSEAMNLAINKAIKAGVTFVVAAGNSGKDGKTFSPGNNPNVISVSAIVDSDGKCGGMGINTRYGNDDTLATFSNFGNTVDIAAPGVNIYSTFKDESYATLSGTSMASPYVAGAVALYKSTHPSASPSSVFDTLVSSGSTKLTCDGKGFGSFSEDKDSKKEPVLYVKNF
ncbi:MAG: peptidase S8 [Nitrososphaeraceae archaeon]|nr:peptidase S8 [Nitrososphaeraceae archaeon]